MVQKKIEWKRLLYCCSIAACQALQLWISECNFPPRNMLYSTLLYSTLCTTRSTLHYLVYYTLHCVLCPSALQCALLLTLFTLIKSVYCELQCILIVYCALHCVLFNTQLEFTTLFTVHYTAYCVLHGVQCTTLLTVHYTVNWVLHCALSTSLCTVYYTVYCSLNCVLCTTLCHTMYLTLQYVLINTLCIFTGYFPSCPMVCTAL